MVSEGPVIDRVYDHLTCPIIRFPRDSRMAVCFFLALALLWGAYLFFYRLVYSFESWFFYKLLGIVFLLVYAAVLSNVLRLFFFWRAVRAVLRRLGQLPMLDAFSRFNREHRNIPRMNLATAPSPLTFMGFSLDEARDLLSSVQKFPEAQDEEVVKIVAQGRQNLKRAEACYERALDAESSRQLKAGLENQISALQDLNGFSHSVESVLENHWSQTADNSGETEKARDLASVLWSWFALDRRQTEKI
jgi:hypothetical protein